MSNLEQLINKTFSSGKKGITIWKRQEGGFQANVQNEDGSWTIRTDDIATDALEASIENAIAFPRTKDAPRPTRVGVGKGGDGIGDDCVTWLRSACLYEHFNSELISDAEFDALSSKLLGAWDHLPDDFKERVSEENLSCGSAIGVLFTKDEMQWARKWMRSQDEDLA